jgi:DNA-directed RNA polymerase delta subunit
MLQRAMVEVAYELLSKKQGPQKFNKFFEEVSDLLSMSEEEKEQSISRFYTKLTLDERFVLLEDNTWDLRERQSFDKVHIDMNDVYSEIDEEEKELKEDEEEEETPYEGEYSDEEEKEPKDDEEEEEENY